MIARPATPPTTPPAIAPASLCDELLFTGVVELLGEGVDVFVAAGKLETAKTADKDAFDHVGVRELQQTQVSKMLNLGVKMTKHTWKRNNF